MTFQSVISLKWLYLVLFFLNLSPFSRAQVTPNGAIARGPKLKSPDVLSDNRVVFRVYAPQATAVTITGEWNVGQAAKESLTKGDSSVWSLTVGPLKPEIYSYTFAIDGVTALDPANVQIRRDGARYASQLLVPGPGSALYAVNDVPHGDLSQV